LGILAKLINQVMVEHGAFFVTSRLEVRPHLVRKDGVRLAKVQFSVRAWQLTVLENLTNAPSRVTARLEKAVFSEYRWEACGITGLVST